MEVHTEPVLQPRARWIGLVIGVAALCVGLWSLSWAVWPDFFVSLFRVEYSYDRALRNYEQNLRDFPRLLAWLSAALGAVAVAACPFEGRDGASLAAASLPRWLTWPALTGLLGLAGWISHHSWVFWNRPTWDGYTKFGEAIHRALVGADQAAFAELGRFVAGYMHSPSPLTPTAIGLLRFAVDDPILCLQLISWLATGVSLILVVRLSARLAPELPAWFVGALFLVNAAIVRSSFFIQLDAASAALALVYLWRWERWSESSSARDLVALVLCATLVLFQKTTLFPLIAVPVIVELVGQWRGRNWNGQRLAAAFAPSAFALVLFGAYVFALDLGSNWARQVAVMGTGWNVLDYSVQRFVFAAVFLLGAFLPFAAVGARQLRGLRLGMLVFSGLFLLGIALTGGPFWSRYYSHIVGPCLIAATPALGQLARLPGSLSAGVVYLGATAVVGYVMLYWQIF
ncbi:MAG: hypothetical protein VCE43_08350 [Myxococcota bacterium]